MHRTPRFARRWIGTEHQLPRYQSVESGQELDNLDAHATDNPAARGIKIHGWPNAPLPLSRASKVDRYSAILLLLFPIPFIGLVITAVALNNKPRSQGGEDVFSLMKLGPTVYPLVFASVAGTTLKTIALWKAERGTTVGTLEKLLGSHTFVHAIENAVALRSLDRQYLI
ncbi:Nn.00g021750.m01.CDS01 [Neocucurbitaria sp. VM-36]